MKALMQIGFAGSYKCDLLLYLARTVLAAGKKVAIVDAVDDDIWSYSVPVYLDNKIVTYSDVDIYLGCKTAEYYEEIKFNNYDIVFVDFGFNKNMSNYMNQCDSVIMVTDIERSNVLKLREYIKAFIASEGFGRKYTVNTSEDGKESENKSQVDIIKIYRDVIGSKINTRYTDTLLDINEKLNVLMEYIVQFDEINYRCQIESQYNDRFRFDKLTKAYKVMLLEIIESCTNLDRKSINKAFKKAERGN
ncbi:hypothetical protein [Acetivibrio cellulolyticus]|uniref:hypothetical protein n=1 Tax=Acetivibrio cellulolyticus TaxID=35830 RepID=UPI0001E2F0E9|nr:hypothetical protein [Acetivibrio cellulolyticus]